MDSANRIEAARVAHLAAGERLAAELWPALRLMAGALLLALAIRSLVAQPFAIPSGSMSPTIEAGDYLFVDKRAYGWVPASFPLAAAHATAGAGQRRLLGRAIQPGDVIAFMGPDGRDFVKRVIGVGGDRVALVGGRLLVNGRPVPCMAAADGLCRELLPNGRSHLLRPQQGGPLADHPETLVPEGHYFVLGDNRGQSADSRLPRSLGGVGLVAEAQVIGRAGVIFLSLGPDGIRWNRIGRRVE